MNLIGKKRIRNILPYISHINNGESIVIGISDLPRLDSILKNLGFPSEYVVGQSILPSGSFGPVSLYNAEGREVINKNLPMETVYHERMHHWTEWHGRYRVEQSGIVEFPYKRYPRSLIAPPSIEFEIHHNAAGHILLTSPVFIKSKENLALLTHTVNLFLEIFGECQLLNKDLAYATGTRMTHLNWEILPKGEMPWEQFKSRIEPIINRTPKSVQPVIFYRFKVVNELGPDFRAVGTGGFHGYVIHGFTKYNIFVLESIYYGNATYIFGETWEEMSKKTKAEVLNAKLQKARIVHRERWKNDLEKFLSGEGVNFKNGKK